MSDIKLACDMAEQIKTICDKHGNKPGELINILHEAQHLQGYLPEETQRIIASKLGIPVSKVYRSEERRVGKECRSRWSPYH